MSVTDVFTYSVSMHRQQSIITEPSAEHSMTNLVNDIPPRDHILINGDLNAPLTADGCRVKHVCGEPNSNSEALQAFTNLHDLIATNGIMREKRSKLPTFDGPRGRWTRLD